MHVVMYCTSCPCILRTFNLRGARASLIAAHSKCFLLSAFARTSGGTSIVTRRRPARRQPLNGSCRRMSPSDLHGTRCRHEQWHALTLRSRQTRHCSLHQRLWPQELYYLQQLIEVVVMGMVLNSKRQRPFQTSGWMCLLRVLHTSRRWLRPHHLRLAPTSISGCGGNLLNYKKRRRGMLPELWLLSLQQWPLDPFHQVQNL